MDKNMLINNLLANYGKYGVTRAELEPIIDDGIQNYDLSLDAIYSGLRMSLASAFNEHEYFSLDDVMAITGESREELLQRIELCRQELIEAGENPDEYFKPIEPQRAAVYYFPNPDKPEKILQFLHISSTIKKNVGGCVHVTYR